MFKDVLDSNITLTELKSIQKEMKCKKSPGPDQILNEMIKYGSEKLLVAINKLFNLVLNL